MRMMEALMMRVEGGRRDAGQPILHSPTLTIGINFCQISTFTAENFFTLYTGSFL